MSDEEVRQLAQSAASHVAQAMIASYEGDIARFQEVIRCILRSDTLTTLALQAAIQAMVQAEINPYRMRDANITVNIVDGPG